MDRVFSNIQRPLLNLHPALIRIAGMPMTQPGPGSPGVSCVLLIQRSVLTLLAEGFGPLIVILESISGVYAQYPVCLDASLKATL